MRLLYNWQKLYNKKIYFTSVWLIRDFIFNGCLFFHDFPTFQYIHGK